MDENRLDQHKFRGRPPYWCINVSDKVPEEYWTTERDPTSETHPGEPVLHHGRRLEIWGLTAWYLNIFMRAVGMW
ncbi:hypothetical protein FRC18_000675 [Serendipita sp. 400]|nr:hypothetical protein FRC18_000675 [Serendipita sp. 400]